MTRELKTRPVYECRCDKRLKTKVEESTLLTYTGLFGELEHLKIETRLIDEMFASVMGMLAKEVAYYESMNRNLKIKPLYDCRCDERLKPKDDESTCLTYTWVSRYKNDFIMNR
jgi:hypothetical protein